MSRLLDNSKELRNQILSRNLYSPDDPYNVENPKFVDAINSISGIIKPVESFDFTNTVLGRLTTPLTPIQQIGVQILSDQLQKTVSNRAKAEFVPTFNIKNLVDGDPNTGFLTKKIDFEITRRENQTTFGLLVEKLTSFSTGKLPRIVNTYTHNDIDLLKNTGKGQLGILVNQLDSNYYKRTDIPFTRNLQSDKLNLKRIDRYISNRDFFPTNQIYFPDINSKIENINIDYRNSLILHYGTNNTQEYGKLEDAYGKNNIYGKTRNLALVEDVLRNGDGVNNPRFGFNNDDLRWGVGLENGSNAKVGLLKLHQGLHKIKRNGLGGNEKIIKSEIDGSIEGKQGSGLYYVPDTAFPNMLREGDGVRQHTIDDPYNNFAKAIRFEGNKVYNQNPNSVIYNNVVPKYAPSPNDTGVNLNVMFSMENLAFDRESEIFSRLPEHEKGFNGRVMWFAPYDVRVIEQVSVKHDTTNFIGRGEPIYSYNSTERSATLSFKLLVDHPSHVKKMKSHREIANFFDFGSTASLNEEIIYGDDFDLIAKEIEILTELEILSDTIELEPIELEIPSDINVFFPNDQPYVSGVFGVTGYIENYVDTTTEIGGEIYENGQGNQTVIDQGWDFGLNEDFNSRIKDIVVDLFSEEKRGQVTIELIGRSSRLFNNSDITISEEYNQELSSRRIQAVKEYIIDQFEIAYPNDNFINKLRNGNIIRTLPRGSQDAGSLGESSENIANEIVKKERTVEILFFNNGNVTQRIDNISVEDKARIKDLEGQLNSISKKRNLLSKSSMKGISSTFNEHTVNELYPEGFQSVVENNVFQSVFYSQTPEDYHRRLTFLHQCTRQGTPITKTADNGNIITSRNSVFGKQPVVIIRLGDQFHTKAIIENMELNYDDAPWDMNPEGMGLQFMTADVTMSLKLIGGQSLKEPIDALQNAVSFNYYGNSTFKKGNGSAESVANEMENKQIASKIFRTIQNSFLGGRNNEE